MKKGLLALIVLIGCASVFAGPIDIPDADPLVALLQLFTQWSALAPLAKASMAIVIFVQLIKKFVPNFKYLRSLVLASGVVYGFIQALATGMPVFDAAVFILITSGGAVALYEAFKGLRNSMQTLVSKI